MIYVVHQRENESCIESDSLRGCAGIALGVAPIICLHSDIVTLLIAHTQQVLCRIMSRLIVIEYCSQYRLHWGILYHFRKMGNFYFSLFDTLYYIMFVKVSRNVLALALCRITDTGVAGMVNLSLLYI